MKTILKLKAIVAFTAYIGLSPTTALPSPNIIIEPKIVLLQDGTKCVTYRNSIECDFKHGDLLRVIDEYRNYLQYLSSFFPKKEEI